ncbi:MAG: hypothetical protein DWQ36_19000 [Acidobacteria bacterium]|nr:MAG: hypothetical protein DWQ30_06640 [Acidobacteriota bacterium]REK03638.1 MAG: hypothetical protein DWQ36_19000 [Acidobacteriota bacterium]
MGRWGDGTMGRWGGDGLVAWTPRPLHSYLLRCTTAAAVARRPTVRGSSEPVLVLRARTRKNVATARILTPRREPGTGAAPAARLS